MAASVLGLWLLWALLGAAQGCTEPCACVDKYAHQFADCAYKDLQEVPSGLPANVTTLSLSANKITSLRQGAFAEVTQVTSLWLAHNEISAIEPGALAVLVQLKNLDISHNQIVDFPWADLRNLSALQLLKMNNNRMAALPADAFRNLRDLRSLRINNNHFSFIAEGTFDALTSLSHLQIYNNPFDCTCRLLWLKAWAENTLISIPERESITCASPPDLKGVPLGSLPALQCAPPTVRLSYQPNVDGAELQDGLALALHCVATGHPVPQIQWRIETAGGALLIERPNANEAGEETPLLSPQRFLAFSNGTLLIPHLSKKEEGTYTCRANNELGSNETSVSVAVAGPQKYPPASPRGELPGLGSKGSGGDRKASGKGYGNSVLTSKSEERTKSRGPWGGQGRASAARTSGVPEDVEVEAEAEEEDPFRPPPFERRCGQKDPTMYVSNHAFNQSADLKPHAFDLGVIALDVAEREAKVQLTPFAARPEKRHLRMLYLCAEGGHAVVQWSRIEEGVNSYWFQGLSPGTNYSVCLTYVGEACQVQVVFTTKKEVPSLVIIVVVSVFLLALATVPLLGATCCHLLSKYQGKNYRLIMKAQNPDQMEKHIAADFDPRASYLESEKNYSPTDSGPGVGEGTGPGSRAGTRGGEEDEDDQEEEEVGGGLERDESLVAGSLPESQSKANQEEFEASSEYSDRLPLGAEAVDIAQEINGNYRQTER
ncbi:immunoglobulin superfamily containing leucine-rich repeat protein 2 [Dromiciops gliroides]|uniref:immunoglobulin superfamily containing leucine-rich repeat protein 2 n=1 Tax=Dromiciops gliroides TaxID=33562 RepID=UPI001CC57CE3|nr:immunoglobulin superfamily containing leucine-rich repeat protein 2 [Dromiciops gliroides]XP_043845034.1 immunoglobulin superfamily containing leucine-rich repeat protein 2 [Dromiciops gliroides]XP_043845035.1 immunoglobulin superfamily containing leucine-rich repeat protein 2 [Dromiciops gliroides]XP_043845036.1 immunoglobulin superfamily containing leucine-rich repeat protein 2 [Dromiciops gliroides]